MQLDPVRDRRDGNAARRVRGKGRAARDPGLRSAGDRGWATVQPARTAMLGSRSGVCMQRGGIARSLRVHGRRLGVCAERAYARRSGLPGQ